MRILQIVNQKDTKEKYVLEIYDSFIFRGHFLIVTEMLNISLYDYTNEPLFIGMPRSMIRHISRQLLTALSYLRDVRIIHGDLKPENILFTDESR